jgi:hypothetical protein
MSSEAKILFERLLPETLEPFLSRALGTCIPRTGEDGRYRVSSTGRFSGRLAADLLAFARNQRLSAAFVIAEEEVLRVLYLRAGVVVGADSNVLFERLGRILFRGGVVTRADARALVNCEESRGLAAAVRMLPKEAAAWGLDKRAWEIGTALYLMSNAHFLFVDGEPELGDVHPVSILPMQLAMEGLRRYDEWRHRKTAPSPAPSLDEEEPAAAPKGLTTSLVQDVDEIMRMITG